MRNPARSTALCLSSLALLLGLALAEGVQAQPFGAWMNFNGPSQNGYVRIPHSTALNPAVATIEGWVFFPTSDGSCRSIIGKNYRDAWWIGRCANLLRSYFRGTSSPNDGGVLPANQWTHFAVVFDGVRKKHYINGELVLDVAAGGAATSSDDEVRIGSDVEFEFTPRASFNQFRFWNVARTEAQIRAQINQALTAAQPGLVAVWPLTGSGQDIIGPHDGSIQGSGVTALTFPVLFDCGPNTATALCLNDRFAISGKFRTGAPGTAEGTMQTVDCPNNGSGLFWFFNANNWEIQVKAINGCGLNNRHWIFSSATTNVFYRMEVLDARAGTQKIYFNYPGPPAPAVTDTGAFATCP